MRAQKKDAVTNDDILRISSLKIAVINSITSYVEEYGSLFTKKKEKEIKSGTSQNQEYTIGINEKKTNKRPESMEAAIAFQKKIADLKGSDFGEFSDNIRNIVGEYYGTKLSIIYPYNLEEDVSYPDWINADGDIVVIVGNKKNPETGEGSLEARVVKNIYSHQFYSYPKPGPETGSWSWPIERKDRERRIRNVGKRKKETRN